MKCVNFLIRMRCFLFFGLLFPVILYGCSKSGDDPEPVKEVKEYPERETKVYMGRSNTWSILGDPNNYAQWEYTRNNVCF